MLIRWCGVKALSAGDASASDRLIDACRVAVAVHAEHVQLRFPDARRTGLKVALTVEFESGKSVYEGQAECGFRATAADEPPSLESISAMGQTRPGMFLMSHHAVWEYFTGASREVSGPDLDFDKWRNRPARPRQVAFR